MNIICLVWCNPTVWRTGRSSLTQNRNINDMSINPTYPALVVKGGAETCMTSDKRYGGI